MTQIAGSLGGANLDAARRRIELPGVLNLRDVGGYPIEGGGSVRWRALLRSDSLHLLDEEGVATLGGLGLRTVLDLRTQAEVDSAASPVVGPVIHVPLLTDLQALPVPSVPDSPGSGLDLGAIYQYFIDQCGDHIAAAIEALTSEDAFPALVHCTAGKDRTGVVIAFILALLGVPDELIGADYALSAVYLDPHQTPVMGRLQQSTGLGDELTSSLLASPPELIIEVLDQVREWAGSVRGYLQAHGVSAVALARLRSALIV